MVLFVSLSACEDTPIEVPASESPAEVKSKPLVLFLGDSIAEGVAGPTPLTERESYAYYGIIGNINDYEYYDRGVSGATTGTFSRYIMREDDGIDMVETLIATADVIHISIIGNDLLNTDHSTMMLNAADGDLTYVLNTKARAKANITTALGRIRELNPDATVIMQTLYNPANENSPLFPRRARAGLAARGYTSANYHDLLGNLIRMMNEVFYELLEEMTVTAEDGTKTAPFELIDVYGEIEKVYNEDKPRYDTLFCEDGIHPFNEGHAIIAELLQKKLEELGLSGENTLAKYKDIRLTQLDRLYAEKTDVAPIRAEIAAATDMRAVTEAYFDGTKGIVADAKLTLNYEGEHFAETTEYRFTEVTVMDMDILAAIDQTKSSIVFRADGSVEARMTVNELTMYVIKLAISREKPNLTDDYQLRMIDPYIHNLFPQADLRDLMSIIKGFEDGYGITFEGIDYESESAETILSTYRETGKILLQDYDFLGKELTIVYRGQYRLDTMTSRKTGETYTAVYLNAGIDKSESYVRFTYSEDENGEKSVRLLIDVAEAVIEAHSA